MIVTKLIKDKKDNYKVIIDNTNEYIFSSDIIVEYRLVEGKEITEAILNDAKLKNNISIYYNKALNYALTYNRTKSQMIDYLLKFDLSNNEISIIIDKLIKVKAVNDHDLIMNYTLCLVNKGYGKLMIEKKLYEHKFEKKDIKLAIENIDYDNYRKKLDEISRKKYESFTKESEYEKVVKVKKYLLSRGYSYEEISNITF